MMKPAESIDEIMQSPFFAKFTREQIRAQLLRNVEGFEKMEARIKKTGKKKLNGYTLEQIIEMKENYKRVAAT